MPDCKVSAQNLSDWLNTAQGRYVLSREQDFFDRSVSDIFGFNALQLGWCEHDFLRASRMTLRTCAGDESGAALRLCAEELPLASESIDLLILPHVLEFAEQPHQILREVERVLISEGSVLISGFNPYSLWGARRAFGAKNGYPWAGEFIALQRLKDWLALLGFVVVSGGYSVHAPPFNLSSALARCKFMETAGERRWAVSGGVYFLHAIKRVPGMRLIQPQWNKKRLRRFVPATPKLNKTHKAKEEISIN